MFHITGIHSASCNENHERLFWPDRNEVYDIQTSTIPASVTMLHVLPSCSDERCLINSLYIGDRDRSDDAFQHL